MAAAIDFQWRQCFTSFVILGSTLVLSACGGGGGGGGGNRVVPRGYDKVSCSASPPDVGPAALFPHLTQTRFVKGIFAKPYDRADLEAVLDSSAVSTTEYVKGLGIQLFRIPRADLKGACQTFFNLDEASPELAEVWNRAAGGVGGDGQLAGLYWENCGTSCRDAELVQPTILVDEATDRWTLIHEMMHHNFNMSRKADRTIPGYTPTVRAMQRSLQRVDKLMKEFTAKADEKVLGDLALEAEVLSKSLYDLAVRGLLEEVAVEGLLLQEWTEGRLKAGNAQATKSSLWYMTGSRESALSRFDSVTDVIQLIKKETTKHSWAVPEAATRVETYVQWVMDSTKKVIDDAKEQVEKKTGQKLSPQSFFAFDGQKIAHMQAHLDSHLDSLEGSEALKEFDEAMAELRDRYQVLFLK